MSTKGYANRVSRAAVTWRYLPGGRCVHALATCDSHTGHQSVAVCGTAWWLAEGWRGTGHQVEYERAAALPECRRCAKLVSAPGPSS